MHVEILPELSIHDPLGMEWEALVKACSSSGFMQSLHWAEFKRKMGLHVTHLGIFDSGKLCGGTLAYCSPAAAGTALLVCPEGPILSAESERVAANQYNLLVGETCRKVAADLGAMALRCEPRFLTPGPGFFTSLPPAPVDLIPKDTLYINLSGGTAATLAAMKPKGRYNIKTAGRHGVEIVTEIDCETAARRLYSVLQEAASRDGFLLEPEEFFVTLHKTLGSDGVSRIIFAEHEGDTLGALLLLTYGPRATYLYGGITNIKRKLMGGYLLQWQAMQMAIASGCAVYDFYGYDRFQSPANNYGRFSQFKSKFGGEAVRFTGARDTFFKSHLADAIVRAFKELDLTSAADMRKAATSGEPSPSLNTNPDRIPVEA